MKSTLFIILTMVISLFAQSANRYYRLTFCTTVLGIDYCNEHIAQVKFEFNNRAIIVSRYGHIIYDMEAIGRWKKNPKTGDSSITVLYDSGKWTLTAKKNSYTLDDHQCALVEFWNGTRQNQRKHHDYIRTDIDDMFSFTDLCEKKLREKRIKN